MRHPLCDAGTSAVSKSPRDLGSSPRSSGVTWSKSLDDAKPMTPDWGSGGRRGVCHGDQSTPESPWSELIELWPHENSCSLG